MWPRIRLTRDGVRILGLSCGILVAALNTSNNLLLLLFSLLVGLLALSPLLAAWNLFRIRVTRELPDRCIEGRKFLVTYEVTHPGILSRSFITIREKVGMDRHEGWVADVRPREASRIQCLGVAGPRGTQTWVGFELVTTYPFNLLSFSRKVRNEATRPVAPSFWKLSLPLSGAAGESISFSGVPGQKEGHGEEFYGVREVGLGETPRRIHWRCTAKQQRLMRVKEEEMRGGPRAVYIHLLGERQGEAFEHDMRLAASVSFTLLSAGGLVTLLWQEQEGWKLMESVRGQEGFHAILDALSTLKPLQTPTQAVVPVRALALNEWMFIGPPGQDLPEPLRGKTCRPLL